MDQIFSLDVKEGVVNTLSKLRCLRDKFALNRDVLHLMRTTTFISTSEWSSSLAAESFRVATCIRRPISNHPAEEDPLLFRRKPLYLGLDVLLINCFQQDIVLVFLQ
jgi:hypothetical protein